MNNKPNPFQNTRTGWISLLLIVALLSVIALIMAKNRNNTVSTNVSQNKEIKDSCKKELVHLMDSPTGYNFDSDDSIEEISVNQVTGQAVWFSSMKVGFDKNKVVNVDFKCIYDYGNSKASLKMRLYY